MQRGRKAPSRCSSSSVILEMQQATRPDDCCDSSSVCIPAVGHKQVLAAVALGATHDAEVQCCPFFVAHRLACADVEQGVSGQIRRVDRGVQVSCNQWAVTCLNCGIDDKLLGADLEICELDIAIPYA